VHSSSNSGSAVSFAAGTKDIFIALTATQFASISSIDLASQVTGTLPIANGGTGQTTTANAINALLPTQTSNSGKYLTTNGTVTSWATVTSNPGTVTSVGGTGTVNGLSLSGTVTSSGNLTLGGALSGVNLTTQVTGTLPVANGGTGTSTGSITGTGALAFTAGGTNQSVTISPSGTGKVLIDGLTVGTAGTTKNDNTVFGYQALAAGGDYANTAIGCQALNATTTGWESTAVGFQALKAQTSGGNNTAIGYASLLVCTSGIGNTSVGAGSLVNLTTGSKNIAIGFRAAEYDSLGTTKLTNPENSIYIGYEVKGLDNSDDNSIVIGYQAIGKGANTTILGNSSTTQTWLGGGELRLPGSTSGYVGLKGAAAAGSVTYTLPSADGTSGQMLSTNGSGAMSWVTVASSGGTVTSVGGTGTVNGLTLTGTVTSSGSLTLGGTLSGVDLASQVTGTLPIANGGTGQTTAENAVNALLPTQTSNSGKFLTTNGTVSSWATVSASPAGSSNQVQYNNGGSFAGASKLIISSTTGFPSCGQASTSNEGFGQSALNGVTGLWNSAFGTLALASSVSGTGNSAFGMHSLQLTTSGQYNTGLGYYAGRTLTTGSNNSFLGAQASPSSNTVNNEITLGNSSISTLRCQVTSITSLSDQRDKTNIQPMPSVLSFIASLNPVQFDWWMRDGAKIGVADYGFIAQELQQAQNSNGFDWAQLVYEDNPEKLEASPGKLIPILVKAIQELAAKVAALEAAV
jgi:hypothetical protein